MDCLTAREILEAVRPQDAGDAEPQVQAAVGHARACVDCGDVWERLQAIDAAVGEALRDVPIPDGLEERLLASLGEQPSQASAESVADVVVPSEPVSVPPRSSRWLRRSAAVAAAAAVVLAAAFLWWTQREGEPPLSVADVYQQVPLDIENLPRLESFADRFEAVPPTGAWSSRRLAVDPPARGVRLAADGEPLVAVYGFRFRDRRGEIVHGVLAAIPARSVAESQALPTSFLRASTAYPRRHAARAWTNDGLVYVAFVPVGKLEDLEQTLDVPLG
ncbi:MAG: hypothetical protein KY476_11720 [Planctomycetes bacterium]|nr:hypothetical protein [Planctomycetota bacterium]